MTQAVECRDPKKLHSSLKIEALAQLLAKVEAGSATLNERNEAERRLVVYRQRYRGGNLSPKTAFELGLIDAKGNEVSQ